MHILGEIAKNMITPAQCRAARAMLNWSRKELAEAAGVAERTIVDFERGARTPYERTLRDVAAALERGGVEFIPANGGGPGVREI
jgi:transcriptional regulator with XRE-family HTH domain